MLARLHKRIVDVGYQISKVFLILINLMFGYEVMMRYVFNRPTGYADELSEYFLSGLVLMALAYALREDAHVRVEILYLRMPPNIIRLVDCASYLIGLLSIIVLIVLSVELVTKYYTSGRVSFSSSIEVPLWIPILMMPIGLFFLAAELVKKLITGLTRKQS